MRRHEKEIFELSAIEAVIHDSVVCRLGISDGDVPYIVPLCFGYKDRTLYFHGSKKGKKITLLRKNDIVCFEFDLDIEVVENVKACDWGVRFRSVIGYGKADVIEDLEEKRKALEIIMHHYSDKEFQFSEKAIEGTAVIRVDVESMTGKQSG
ncbi:pyridoxamine 5'-phosphate oxidase family protein [Thermodesulfobacteriota bacterium]